MEIENKKQMQIGKRPDSLTNLCMLSVMGVVFWTYLDISNYFEYQSQGWLNKNSFLVSVAINMIVLFSVFLMGSLKKIGFYLYAVSQTAWLSFPFCVDSWVDTCFGLLTLPAFVFTILFIVLYARNLKYMG